MASTTPQDAHLGVPISLWGLMLNYDHHVCHPRNGERWREEGKSGAARTRASKKILIERREEFVCQPPCRNNTPLSSPCHLSPECTCTHTFKHSSNTPPFTTSTANTAKPKIACRLSSNRSKDPAEVVNRVCRDDRDVYMYTAPMKLVEQRHSSKMQSVSYVNYCSVSDLELRDNIPCLTGEEKKQWNAKVEEQPRVKWVSGQRRDMIYKTDSEDIRGILRVVSRNSPG